MRNEIVTLNLTILMTGSWLTRNRVRLFGLVQVWKPYLKARNQLEMIAKILKIRKKIKKKKTKKKKIHGLEFTNERKIYKESL